MKCTFEINDLHSCDDCPIEKLSMFDNNGYDYEACGLNCKVVCSDIMIPDECEMVVTK